MMTMATNSSRCRFRQLDFLSGIAGVQERWRTCNPYLVALAIYGSSRLVVIWAVYIAPHFVLPSTPDFSPFAWTPWYHGLLRWDSAWYYTILNQGYNYNGDDAVEQTINFFPLYPLTAKALTIFPGIDGSLALIIVSNVAAILSVLM